MIDVRNFKEARKPAVEAVNEAVDTVVKSVPSILNWQMLLKRP